MPSSAKCFTVTKAIVGDNNSDLLLIIKMFAVSFCGSKKFKDGVMAASYFTKYHIAFGSHLF